MKALKTTVTVLLSIFMLLYIVIAGVLLSVNRSFTDNSIQRAVGESGMLDFFLSGLVDGEFDQSSAKIEHTAEDMPAASRLFSDIFGGVMRELLYDEEYDGVSDELLRDFIAETLALSKDGRNLSQAEIDDSVDGVIKAYKDSVDFIVEEFRSIAGDDEKAVIGFIASDLALAATVSALLNLVVIVLINRRKLAGLIWCAAVFVLGGITMFVFGGMTNSLFAGTGDELTVGFMSILFRYGLQNVGLIMFAIAAAMVAVFMIRKLNRDGRQQELPEKSAAV